MRYIEIARIRAYWELTKPRLSLLVLFSTLTGYYLGISGSIEIIRLFNTLLGVGVACGGALALNQWIEREHDAEMKRTRGRPLPSGRLTPGEALRFGLILCCSGVGYLNMAVNILTGLVVLLTILIYLLIYTPLKRISVFNTVIGAIPGALPIVCGWTAARNTLNIESWVLFGILFFWQFPHFLSIALIYREEYQAAGYKMLPAIKNGIQLTSVHIVVSCVVLLGISIVPGWIGLTGGIYAWVAFAAGGAFLGYGIGVAFYKTRQMAKRLMFASFGYPLLVWGVMIFDKITV